MFLQWCLSHMLVHFRECAMTCAVAEDRAPDEKCTKYFLLLYSPFFYLGQTSKHKHSNLLLDKETRESKDLYKHIRRKVGLKNKKKTKSCLLMKEKNNTFLKTVFSF